MEILLSLGLLSVAALAMMTVVAHSLPYARLNREAATASGLARGMHEQILAMTSLPAGQSFQGGAAQGGFPPSPYPSAAIDGKTYTFKVTTQASVDCPNAIWVDVEVDWEGGHSLHQQSLYYAP